MVVIRTLAGEEVAERLLDTIAVVVVAAVPMKVLHGDVVVLPEEWAEWDQVALVVVIVLV